ncbi:hypothetical protein JZ751_011289 [Albula glossodonta]|uniref:Shootin-1 n=1 Tax=Albula glossodonta TaxID=121402 RepID=A0A8T2P7K4_9TELE|nr:hypothetical protein JZ751_011289 [Albula glossodonta]
MTDQNVSFSAIQEYEGLQEEHEKTKMECERVQKERDDAMRKLKEFQRVSRMVIEEVNIIQENLEIEKSCRQNAEALASKLNRQNKSLKRKSMLYLSHLGPEVIAEISIEDDDKDMPAEENEEGTGTCSSGHCQQIISDEKGRLAIELGEEKEKLKDLKEELLEEKHNNTLLIAETVEQKKLLAKYNRVSLLVLEEYEELQENLSLEKDLRMLVEQKKLNRQSQILLQDISPEEALQKALQDIATLTQALEMQKLEHQKQVKDFQERMQSSELRREVAALKQQIDLLQEEKAEWEDRCAKAEVQRKSYDRSSSWRPIPHPLHPLHLRHLLHHPHHQHPQLPIPLGKEALDIRQQAVDEMMERIKKGVQLRPVSPATSRAKKPQKVTPDSAIQELKGILDTFQRPTPAQYKAGAPAPEGNAETELERVLQRRRCAFETTQNSRVEASSTLLPSSVLDMTRVKAAVPQAQPHCPEPAPSQEPSPSLAKEMHSQQPSNFCPSSLGFVYLFSTS